METVEESVAAGDEGGRKDGRAGPCVFLRAVRTPCVML